LAHLSVDWQPIFWAFLSGLSRAPPKAETSAERTQKIAARENAGEARPLATAASGTRQPPPAAAAPAEE